MYQVAFLRDDGTPSGVRIGSTTTENHAAHRALRLSNVQHCNTCVVEADTDTIVQTVRYSDWTKSAAAFKKQDSV